MNQKLGRGRALFSRAPLPHSCSRGRLSTSDDARGKSKRFRDAIQRTLASPCEGSVASSAARPHVRTEQGPTFQAERPRKRFHRDPPRYHARGHVQQQAISACPARTSPWRADLQCRWGHGARPSSWLSAAGTRGGENGHDWLSSRSGSGPNAQLSLCRPGHHRCAVALPVRNQHAFLRGDLPAMATVVHLHGRSWKTLAAQRRKRLDTLGANLPLARSPHVP